MGERIYLVTGAAGHLGSVVTAELVRQGERVRALLLPGEPNPPAGAEAFYGDVRDRASMEAFFNCPGQEATLIHTAGIVSIASAYSELVYDVNVTGTKNVLAMCMEHGVKKLIHVSSVHAIPEKPKGETITEVAAFDPDGVIGCYAKTKAEASAAVLEAAAAGLDASIVHPSGIAGPFDRGRGHLTVLVSDYYKRRLTSGLNGGYDFVDVRDVARGIIACAGRGRRGECYILSNRYSSIPEIFDALHDITGKPRVTRMLPIWFIKPLAPVAELYYKLLRQPPLFTAYSIYTLGSNSLFSHEKATRELGYEPEYDLHTMLADTVNWLRSEGRL